MIVGKGKRVNIHNTNIIHRQESMLEGFYCITHLNETILEFVLQDLVKLLKEVNKELAQNWKRKSVCHSIK